MAMCQAVYIRPVRPVGPYRWAGNFKGCTKNRCFPWHLPTWHTSALRGSKPCLDLAEMGRPVGVCWVSAIANFAAGPKFATEAEHSESLV